MFNHSVFTFMFLMFLRVHPVLFGTCPQYLSCNNPSTSPNGPKHCCAHQEPTLWMVTWGRHVLENTLAPNQQTRKRRVHFPPHRFSFVASGQEIGVQIWFQSTRLQYTVNSCKLHSFPQGTVKCYQKKNQS